ncbi:helix-turn-helix transcriptional regulator [Dyadobacter sp. BHUBP1]|uniref:helix-turn-helix transcriptional regulator n=1 Tax=Dyadobacter sp. BHUBP1 TaxID=3424178 RepID=UPI003D342F55
MHGQENIQRMLYWAERMGIPVASLDGDLQTLHLNEVRIIDVLPEMLVMIRSVVAEKAICYRRKSIDIIQRGLLISFQNIISHPANHAIHDSRLQQAQPHVRITPLHLESEIQFPEGMTIRQISILIELDYLKSYLGKQYQKFEYLFHQEKTLLIEEFMSPEMALVVNELVDGCLVRALPETYYRLKSLELLYLLFTSLSNRHQVPQQHLRNEDIAAVYRVRDKIERSLDKPWILNELVKLSGMNAIRLRRIFVQVFGKGIYEYYQFLRMQEAARLMQQERISVSEAGYRVGFTNLSHFGRLFERHFGAKPKKWSSNLTL